MRLTLPRVAGWLAFGYALAPALPYVYGAFADGDGGALFGSMIIATWSASPVVAAACFVAASRTRLGAGFYFVVQLALIATFAWEFFQVWYVHPTSTSGMIFIGLPLLQLGALFAVAMTAPFFGWRAKESWLNV